MRAVDAVGKTDIEPSVMEPVKMTGGKAAAKVWLAIMLSNVAHCWRKLLIKSGMAKIGCWTKNAHPLWFAPVWPELML